MWRCHFSVCSVAVYFFHAKTQLPPIFRCSSKVSHDYQRYIPGTSSDNDETHLCTLSLNPKETFNLALKFLQKLFQPPRSTRLHVDLDKHKSFDELLTSDFVKNVTSLTVHSDESKVTEEQFKFIFEKFHKLQSLDMSKTRFSKSYLRGMVSSRLY